MDQPLAERMLRAFLKQMIKTEAVDPDDMVEIVEVLHREGDEDAAHAMAALIVEANAPDQSDWEAERARARFHVIQGNDGKPQA
jgi:hypothetical protein